MQRNILSWGIPENPRSISLILRDKERSFAREAYSSPIGDFHPKLNSKKHEHLIEFASGVETFVSHGAVGRRNCDASTPFSLNTFDRYTFVYLY
jgi:hypothetical protein